MGYNGIMTLHFKNYIISAPSGTGKTTLNRRLVKAIPELEFSISHTTRPIRSNEREGDHYYFVDKPAFNDLIKNHALLEWAEVFGNFYGTSFGELKRINAKGHSALLEIDVQGCALAKNKLDSVCCILLLPPSMKVLWERLQGRGTDSLETITKRFQTARKELEQAHLYEHFVINDSIDEAFEELRGFIVHQKPLTLSKAQGLAFCKRLASEL